VTVTVTSFSVIFLDERSLGQTTSVSRAKKSHI
jgi:hypothetical protein